MFRTQLGSPASHKVLWKWWLLGFTSGQINAGGFLATGRFVSHMTGFATLIGVAAGHGNWSTALGLMTVPGFFLLGTFISGYLVEVQIIHVKRPRFDWVMLLVILCLLLVAVGGGLNWLGNFGQEIQLRHDYVAMALLCLACGLQNAAISSSSEGTVRVTHLTGLTTDMGIGWIRWWTLRRHPETARMELRKSEFRLGMIVAFTLGSAVAAAVFLRYGYFGFLLPTVCSIYPWWEARRAIREKSEYLF
jgi:uncharacterized membrane protein YoaK (UPF0700 family)